MKELSKQDVEMVLAGKGLPGELLFGESLAKYFARLYLATKESRDSQIARMEVELSGADERSKMIFEAKNHWADRARKAEAQIAALAAQEVPSRSRENFIALCNQFWNWTEFDEINAGEEEPRLEWDGSAFTHRVTQALWRMYQAAPSAPPVPDLDLKDSWPDCSLAEFGTYSGCVTLKSPQGKVVQIDACLVCEIVSLWRNGVVTHESCCGHGKAESYIAVDLKDIGLMLNMGYQPEKGRLAEGMFISKSSLHSRTKKPAGKISDLAALVPDEMLRGFAGQVISLVSYNVRDKELAEKIWAVCRAEMLRRISGIAPQQEAGNG